MSNFDSKYRKTHHVAGIVLGVIGILCALLLSFLFGVAGGAAALLLGVIALLLGIQARKAGKGMGAIITGALAIVLAIALTVSTINVFTALHKAAVENGETPLMAKYAEKPYLGFMGIIIEAAKGDEASLEQMAKELEILNKEGVLNVDGTNVTVNAKP